MIFHSIVKELKDTLPILPIEVSSIETLECGDGSREVVTTLLSGQGALKPKL